MAESIIAERKPPWTMPAGLRKRSSTRIATRRTRRRFVHARQPEREVAVGRDLEGHAKGYPVGPSSRARERFTTLVTMTDTLFPGASELEGRAIREISAVAMDAPAAANSGPQRHGDGARAAGRHALVARHASRPHRPTWSDRDRFILSNGHAASCSTPWPTSSATT
jgi:hypothetical protein